MIRDKTLKRLAPPIMVVLIIVVIMQGVWHLRARSFFYTNYLGGVLIPVFSIIGGIFMLVVLAIMLRLRSRWTREKSKPLLDKRGRAVRFPVDDYKKW